MTGIIQNIPTVVTRGLQSLLHPGFSLATDVSNPALPLVAVCDPAQAAPQDDLHLTPDLSHLPTGPGPGVPPHLLQD